MAARHATGAATWLRAIYSHSSQTARRSVNYAANTQRRVTRAPGKGRVQRWSFGTVLRVSYRPISSGDVGESPEGLTSITRSRVSIGMGRSPVCLFRASPRGARVSEVSVYQ